MRPILRFALVTLLRRETFTLTGWPIGVKSDTRWAVSFLLVAKHLDTSFGAFGIYPFSTIAKPDLIKGRLHSSIRLRTAKVESMQRRGGVVSAWGATESRTLCGARSMLLFRLGILLQAICGNSDSNNVVSRHEYLQFVRRGTALENHRKKHLARRSRYQAFIHRETTPAIKDATPETADFGFNRFKSPQD